MVEREIARLKEVMHPKVWDGKENAPCRPPTARV